MWTTFSYKEKHNVEKSNLNKVKKKKPKIDIMNSQKEVEISN